MGEIRDVGDAIFGAANASASSPPRHGALDLALSIYGGDVFVLSPHAQVESCTAIVRGRTKIVLRSGMTPRRTHYAVARMLARLEIQRSGHTWTDALERAVAGYLVAPASAFGRVVRDRGAKLSALASTFVVTETCAALRLLELRIRSGVVVTPRTVYRPGRELGWVSDDGVRKLAMGDPRSVRRWPITDEPGRVALFTAA